MNKNLDYETISKMDKDGVLKMYETNRNDVIEALKNEHIIQEKLKPFGPLMLTSPLSY